MGIIRKTTSVLTLGLVDFRSDRERLARNSKKILKEMKKANKSSK